jgi:hypothetical protein
MTVIRARPPGSVVRLAALAGLVAALGACSAIWNDSSQESQMPERSIEEVQEAHTPAWLEIEGVVGSGIGECEGEPCIRVFLTGPSPRAEEVIPERVEGYRVELHVTGPFRPRDSSAVDGSD